MNDTTQHVLELLERIQALELEVTLSQPLYSRRQLEARFEQMQQERDAALEQVRVLEEAQNA